MLGDVNYDKKLSTSECEDFLNSYPAVPALWNGYDNTWYGLSNEEKCAELDSNIDSQIKPDELMVIVRHLMFLGDSSEANLQWEFENRYKQISCKQCNWYENYIF